MDALEIRVGQEVCFYDDEKYPILGHGVVQSLEFEITRYNALVPSAVVKWTDNFTSTVPVVELVDFHSEVNRKVNLMKLQEE